MKRIHIAFALLLLAFLFACNDSSGSSDTEGIEIKGTWFYEDTVVPSFHFILSIYDNDFILTVAQTNDPSGIPSVTTSWGTVYSYNNTGGTCIVNWIDMETTALIIWTDYQKFDWSINPATDVMTLDFFYGGGTVEIAQGQASPYLSVDFERKLP